ncbi:MAG: DUF488 domain-containing protein [Pirellulales bacterium]|nr:DUF488 domain-containing protein [Pirellulales bacterium]
MTAAKLFTIGFTKTDAETFFSKLKAAGITKIIDVRLNNVSQLAGFAKRNDLAYFLKELCGCDYVHRPELAPTKEMLDAYKSKTIDWPEYARQFNALLAERAVENAIFAEQLNGACLLCSEPTAEHCHRRLVAEYCREKHPEIEIVHL